VVSVLPLITQSTYVRGWATPVADVIAGRKAPPSQLPNKHPDHERDADLLHHDVMSPRGPLVKFVVKGANRELFGRFQGPGDDIRVLRVLEDPNLPPELVPTPQVCLSQRLTKGDHPPSINIRTSDRAVLVHRQCEQGWETILEGPRPLPPIPPQSSGSTISDLVLCPQAKHRFHLLDRIPEL
jgi:hypothetical protein